jgi:DNA-binding HxlR family transcriptional regulator
MKKNEAIDNFYPECPIRNILARICDKWSMLVLFTLNKEGEMRFSQIQKSIPDVSQKMLTQTLRKLEEDGLVSRKVFAEVPPRVEYALTKRSLSLIPCIDTLICWAVDNMNSIIYERTLKMNNIG